MVWCFTRIWNVKSQKSPICITDSLHIQPVHTLSKAVEIPSTHTSFEFILSCRAFYLDQATINAPDAITKTYCTLSTKSFWYFQLLGSFTWETDGKRLASIDGINNKPDTLVHTWAWDISWLTLRSHSNSPWKCLSATMSLILFAMSPFLQLFFLLVACAPLQLGMQQFKICHTHPLGSQKVWTILINKEEKVNSPYASMGVLRSKKKWTTAPCTHINCSLLLLFLYNGEMLVIHQLYWLFFPFLQQQTACIAISEALLKTKKECSLCLGHILFYFMKPP